MTVSAPGVIVWVNCTVIEAVEKDFIDKVENNTSDAIERGKTGFEQIGEEFQEIIETVEEVAKEMWGDVRGIFGQGGKQGEVAETVAHGNKTEKPVSLMIKTNSSATTPTRRKAFRLA